LVPSSPHGGVEELGGGAKDGPEVIGLEDAHAAQALEVGKGLEEALEAARGQGGVYLPLVTMGHLISVTLRADTLHSFG
jgi:hypothetical protein